MIFSAQSRDLNLTENLDRNNENDNHVNILTKLTIMCGVINIPIKIHFPKISRMVKKITMDDLELVFDPQPCPCTSVLIAKCMTT